MNLFLLQQYKFIQDLYKNENFIDILINIDDFFDILNVYAFPNWIDSEIVGVDFMKYFTQIKLKTPIDKMPHPKGAQVLLKYDCHIKYKKTKEVVPVEVKSNKDVYFDNKSGEYKPKVEEKECWIIDILIPNKHIINEKIYDLETMQDKVEEIQEKDDELESVVENE